MKNKRRFESRLKRIEKKCDRILSELLIIRHRLSSQQDIDSLIDLLHRNARSLRSQCEREREAIKGMFTPKMSGR